MFGGTKSEVELLKASLAGSTQAFEAVIGRYQSLVCAITYGATGDVGHSEELAQEAFLRAWTSLGQLQDLAKFRAWLCSIARSVVQNWFRSQRHDVVGHAAPLDVAAEKVSEQCGPEEAVMIEEQQVVVRRALAGMPETLREPLVLFYREGRSTREVAELLGLSENAARQRISRGRSMLREQVADMIETAIARSRPSKAFTASVIASIMALGVRGSATAATAVGVASSVSALTAKIATVAVGIVALAGGIAVYRQLHQPAEPPVSPAAIQPVRQGQSDQSIPLLWGTAEEPKAGGNEGQASRPAEASVAAGQVDSARGSAGRERSSGAAEAKAEPFEFKPRGVLSGRITDIETGEPVRDARLRIWVSRLYTARTDANGFYFLETIEGTGDFRVTVASQEYIGIPSDGRTLLVHLDPDKQTIRHFLLSKACMVDVWVVDANGVGIKDARVVATALTDARKREIDQSAFMSPQTDPNGYVLLGGFAPAETDYVITVWHTVDTGFEQQGSIRITQSECDYAPTRATIRLTDPNVVRQLEIVLEAGQTMPAIVEYADGVPAAETEIDLKPTWWHCEYLLPGYKTGGDGTLSVKHITPGLYDVFVRTPTGDAGFVSRKVMQARLPPADGGPLIVRLPGRSPQSLVSISGSLVYRGQPRPSFIQIRGSSPTGQPAYGKVTPGLDGGAADTFVVDRLEPGTYTLTFSGQGLEETTIPNVVAPSSDLRVELVCTPKPRVAGTVVDAGTGKAIQEFRVRIRKLRTLRGPPYVQINSWVHYEQERGEFGLDVSGPGIYRVQAIAEGYAPAWSEEINTEEQTPALVALSPGGTISGRVVDEQGEPVDSAKVIALSLAGGTMPDTEDVFLGEEGAVETVQGAFTLRQIPLGLETLKVTHPQHAPQTVPEIAVVAGRDTDGIKIVLTKGGVVEGCVYDLQGKPVAGQVLYAQTATGPDAMIYAEASRLGQAVTDANGFYRIECLPEQLCHVKRMDEQQGLGVLSRTVLPRNGRTIRLDLGGVPVVRGRVVVDGLPLARTRLMFGVAGSLHTGAFRGYTIMDEQGAFTFGGTPPGAYAVHAERPNESSRWLPLGTVTVGETDVDVGVLPTNVARLLVTVKDAGTGGTWPVGDIYLTTEPRPWSASVGTAGPPSTPGGPYLIRNLEPGRYVLNIRRRDRVTWLRPVEVPAGRHRVDLAIDLPDWKAGVSGRIRGAPDQLLGLCRQEKDLFLMFRPGPDGAYRVEHLPAGRYWIGTAGLGLYDLPSLAEFDLQENEQKVLDLDLSAAPTAPMGFVLVRVVDEFGSVCDDAQIRLDGPQGTVSPLYSAPTGRGFLTVPGPHTVHVQAAGRRPVVEKLNVKPFDPQRAMPQIVLICVDR